ncbi:MAG: type I-E CRISPR-associated protein Cas5/CasD [Pseudomonadota bacterium]
MSEWLVIQLAAPLASFGELAGVNRRGGVDRPGKGALLGLVGAALGLRRTDDDGQRALAEGYAVATRAWKPGRVLQDYHTFQSVKSNAREPFSTRADALRRGAPVTSISVREYRMDVLFDAAYRAKAGARWSLAALRDALERPAFTLSLGRKACPLAAPLAPVILGGESARAAFDAADATWDAKARTALFADRQQRRARPLFIAEEEADAQGRHATEGRIERRYDQPLDRRAWHFAQRAERVTALNETDPEDDDG